MLQDFEAWSEHDGASVCIEVLEELMIWSTKLLLFA